MVASNGSYTLDLTLHNIHKDPVIVEASSASGASRARLDWAYEFLDRTGPDSQICRTGPAGLD